MRSPSDAGGGIAGEPGRRRVVLLSTVFPNAAQPHHGVFVRERMRGLPEEVEVRVVAPVPWFPLVSGLRPGYRPAVAREEERDGATVLHPRFLSVPGILKCLDGLFLFLGALPALRRLRKEFPFEAIDAHFAYPEGLAAALAGIVFRVPVVLTLRGMLPLLAPFRLRRPQMRFALKRAARIVAVSDSLRRDAEALGVPPGRVRVVPNGIDSDLFRPHDRRQARRALGLPEEGPLLVSVGTLAPRKGFHLVLEALPELARRWPGVRFAMVGGAGAEAAMGEELRRLAERLGVADRAIFAGPRGRDELPLWYGAADVSVLASAHEGCPNVVIEALACGTPVVGTPVGSVPELLGDGEVGLLAERDVSSLTARIAEALQRDWDRERVRARVAGRTWRVVGREVAEEIEAAIDAGPGRPGRAAGGAQTRPSGSDSCAPSSLDPAAPALPFEGGPGRAAGGAQTRPLGSDSCAPSSLDPAAPALPFEGRPGRAAGGAQTRPLGSDSCAPSSLGPAVPALPFVDDAGRVGRVQDEESESLRSLREEEVGV